MYSLNSENDGLPSKEFAASLSAFVEPLDAPSLPAPLFRDWVEPQSHVPTQLHVPPQSYVPF